MVFPRVISPNPLRDGLVIYTDGSKSGLGAYVVNEKIITRQFKENSPQLVECLIVLEVLKNYSEPLNIVSHSAYVVNAVQVLEVAGIIKPSSKIAPIFIQLQQVLLMRRFQVYITHIHVHSGLPGPMSIGNDLADKATRLAAVVLASSLDKARDFHKQFHVTTETLHQRFALT